jgi:hypothetical protein
MSSPSGRAASSLTPLEAHLRTELLALTGLTHGRIERLRAEAMAAGVPELRLLHAAGAWLELVTTHPLTPIAACALADVLTAAIQRPVDVRVVKALPLAEGGRDPTSEWARAVPLWR